jgi:hypothetical protein
MTRPFTSHFLRSGERWTGGAVVADMEAAAVGVANVDVASALASVAALDDDGLVVGARFRRSRVRVGGAVPSAAVEPS